MNKILSFFLLFSFINANLSDNFNTVLNADKLEQSIVLGVSDKDMAEKVFGSAFYQISATKSIFDVDCLAKLNFSFLENLNFFNKAILEVGVKKTFFDDYNFTGLVIGNLESLNSLSYAKFIVDKKVYEFVGYYCGQNYEVTGYADVLVKFTTFDYVALNFGASSSFKYADQEFVVDSWIGSQIYPSRSFNINISCGILF